MYEFHPLADIFPMLDDDELKALAEDIKAKGLTEPITLYEDKVLRWATITRLSNRF
jgi:ParB-like chromosome segregation protein Spo0J